jgi:hypothetical protein
VKIRRQIKYKETKKRSVSTTDIAHRQWPGYHFLELKGQGPRQVGELRTTQNNPRVAYSNLQIDTKQRKRKKANKMHKDFFLIINLFYLLFFFLNKGHNI